MFGCMKNNNYNNKLTIKDFYAKAYLSEKYAQEYSDKATAEQDSVKTSNEKLAPIDFSLLTKEGKAFIGHAKHLPMSTDYKKAEELASAFHASFPRHPLFQDAEHIHYAMTAFVQGYGLSLKDINIILERQAFIKVFGEVETLYLLDEKGEFTEHALNYLIPSLEANPYLSTTGMIATSDDIAEFKCYLQQLPRAYATYYWISEEHKAKDQHFYQLFNIPCVANDVCYMAALSLGARDAFCLAYYSHDAKNIIYLPRTISDVEMFDGLKHFTRYGSIGYTDAILTEVAHNEEQSLVTMIMHDEKHRIAISSMPPQLIKAIIYSVELLKEKLGGLQTPAIAGFSDCEFFNIAHIRYKAKENLSSEQLTAYFFSFLETNFIYRHAKEKDLMAVVLNDMLLQKKHWLEQFNIDVKCTPESHQELLSFLKKEPAYIEEVLLRYQEDTFSEQTASTQPDSASNDECDTVKDLDEANDESFKDDPCGFKRSCCII